MGLVTTTNGSQVPCDEVEGTISLKELYEYVQNTQYTSGFRVDCIKACGKVGRGAYGILMYLHDLAAGANKTLAEAAKETIRKIDPGMPDFGSPASSGNTKATISQPKSKELTFSRTNANGGTVQQKLERQKVKIAAFGESDDLSEGTRVYATCNFCDKTTILAKNILGFNKSVVGEGKMYCTNCLRNGMYRPRISRNTLMLTYRGIIGYYYHCFHLAGKSPPMYLHDIQGYIDLQQKFGQNNPLFRYDPETYIWFVDFSRVGTGKRQVPVEHILETIVEQVAALNLYEVIKESSPAALYNKYKEAIIEFLHHRRRPPNAKLLCPTLYSCGVPHDNNLGKAVANETLKRFTPYQMVDNFKNCKKNTSYAGCYG